MPLTVVKSVLIKGKQNVTASINVFENLHNATFAVMIITLTTPKG